MATKRHNLGEQIAKQLRKDKRSQAWLGEQVGVTRYAVGKWLVKDGNRISAENLQAICDVTHADKNEFFKLAIETWPKFTEEYESYLKQTNQQTKDVNVEKPNPTIELPDLPDLKSKTCPIYFELKLGKEEIIKDPSDRRERPIYEFPMWKERSEDWRKHFTETPAHTLLQQWSQQAGFHPIVGEPGGGKSTLLRSWAHKLVEMSTQTKQYLPLLVPLREVDETGLEGFFDKQGFDVRPYLENKVEGVQPVWLFDGLDELPKKYKDRWMKLIKAQKQHPVLLTCRTALWVWDSDHRVNFSEPHYLMGMYSKEQKKFLLALAEEWQEGKRYEYGFEDADEAWVDELHSKLQSQASLKQLAGSPLLLTLIARTNKPNNIDLPSERVIFYQRAFSELLKQREDDEVNIWTFIEPLSKLAFEVSKDELKAEFSQTLFEKHLKAFSSIQITTLKKSSILKFRSDGNCQWLHQTFQEWLLAEYLHLNDGLLASTKRYWKDLNYNEVLVLLWGLSNADDQLEAARFLINEGCQTCLKNSNRSRSGLKTLLSLISLSLNTPSEALIDFIWEHTTSSLRRKEVIAQGNYTPEFLLTHFADDGNKYILVNVAANPNTSVKTLKKLSDDIDDVRVWVAANKNTTTEVLAELSTDNVAYVRRAVALHPNTSVETLVELANDPIGYVRWGVEINSNTPNTIRHALSQEEGSLSNLIIPSKPTPQYELVKNEPIVFTPFKKEEDDDAEDSIIELALDTNTSQNTLAKLAKNGNFEVVLCVAENSNTSSETLTTLAELENEMINEVLATNPTTPSQILAILSQNEDFSWDVAINPNSCLEWF